MSKKTVELSEELQRYAEGQFQAEIDSGIAELDAGKYAEGSAAHFAAALKEKRAYSEL